MGIPRVLAALTWMSFATLSCTLGSGESESDGGSSSTTMGETSETHELDPGCACIDGEEGGVLPSTPTCGALLCPTVEVTCQGSESAEPLAACRGDSATLLVSNPDALTCALESLRDRSEGFVEWVANKPEQHTDYGYVAIHADGRGVDRTWNIYDLDHAVSDAVLGELDPAATFEACLNTDDAPTRFFCLVDALAGESLAVCDAGWQGDLAS